MTRATKNQAEEEFEILGARDVGWDDENGERPRYINWDDLAEDEAAVLISIRGIGPEEDTDYGTKAPVIARVIVLTGEYAGEIYQDVKIFKGGIAHKCEKAGDGKHVVGRLEFYEFGEGRNKREAVGLTDHKPSDMAKAKGALAKYKGVDPLPEGWGVKDEDEDEEKPARRSRGNGTAANGRNRNGRGSTEDAVDSARSRRGSSRSKSNEVTDDGEPPF